MLLYANFLVFCFRIALKYSFVTDVSSLVVVKPNATLAVNTEDASKMPDSQTDQGIPFLRPHSRYRKYLI